jgi:hypothetical protein
MDSRVSPALPPIMNSNFSLALPPITDSRVFLTLPTLKSVLNDQDQSRTYRTGQTYPPSLARNQHQFWTQHIAHAHQLHPPPLAQDQHQSSNWTTEKDNALLRMRKKGRTSMKKSKDGPWDDAEQKLLIELLCKEGATWKSVMRGLAGRSLPSCRGTYVKILRRQPPIWKPEEDDLLIKMRENDQLWSDIIRRMPGRPFPSYKQRYQELVRQRNGPVN